MPGFRFRWDLIESLAQAKVERYRNRKVESAFQGQFN